MTIAVRAALCMRIRASLNPCMTITLWGLVTVSASSHLLGSKFTQAANWLQQLRQKNTQTSSQTDTLKHKLYMNTLTHTYQRGGRCWSYLSVHFSLCLDPSNLRLQEQIREKTVIKVTVGSTGRHTRKRTASLYRRFTKHTKDPNYLFSCLREETSSSQISN